MATRPTTDRVREALFAVLGDVSDLRVLDCYAGSGALGLEALSRGARHCTFVESSKEASAVIRRNLQTLEFADRAELVVTPVQRAGGRLKQRHFDLVLSDPPWPICQQAAPDVLRLVRPLVDDQSVIVLGHPTRDPLKLDSPTGFTFEKTRSWGDSAMTFLRLE
jgi:16S rRNA (guanine966-N2)-methyltransferase